MKRTFVSVSLALAFLSLGLATSDAGVSISIGRDGFYLSVGDYDYLPYAYNANPAYAQPRINFHDMMSQYGIWLPVQYFGMVWKPYASYGWRPYMYGHWIYTQYGPTWEGYEPWAWVGYHYGDWIFDRQYGWVWIPGYDWHPSHVIWARSYGSIGWMPAPPAGYDYSRGYLSNVGQNNQYSYDDPDFSNEYGSGNYTYGGPYYDPRYRDMYYNPSYSSININLWVFINNTNFGDDDYAKSALGSDYARHVFDRNLVKITNRQMPRNDMERLVGQRIQEMPVDVRELRTTDQRSIKVVVPRGSEAVERIRQHSGEVVREIIAPGFAERQKSFKGQNSTNKEGINKLFHQEKVEPRVQTLSPEQVIDQAHQVRQNLEQIRIKRDKDETDKLIKIEKEGKIQKPDKEPAGDSKDLNQNRQDNNNEPQPRNELEKRHETGKPNEHHDIVAPRQENRQSPGEDETVGSTPTEATQDPNPEGTGKEPGNDSQLEPDAKDKDKKNEKDRAFDVKAALKDDKHIDASDIDVGTDADEKTVTLKGTVPTAAQKEAAEKLAKDTAHGYKVLNLLRVAKK